MTGLINAMVKMDRSFNKSYDTNLITTIRGQGNIFLFHQQERGNIGCFFQREQLPLYQPTPFIRQGIYNNNRDKRLTLVFAFDLGTFSLAEYFKVMAINKLCSVTPLSFT